MKAFLVTKYGKNEQVRIGELPVPEPGERDVLVRVAAASVNPVDVKIMQGEFKLALPYKPPFVLGSDVAGVVERRGAAVTRFAVGDTVYARPDTNRIGTFAEYIAIHEDDLALAPAGLSMAEAASLPLVALTAWQALVEIADVQPGQRVLIHAGTGGVGTIAIQLAKHLGAHVITTVSAANAELVRGLGADEIVDYRTQRFDEMVHDIDVVLDSQGPDNVLQSLSVLRPGGVVVGLTGPPDPDFATVIGKPLLRPILVLASRKVRAAAKMRGVRYRFLFMRASGKQLGEITALVESGAIRPVIDKIFDFTDTPGALEYVATGHVKGKVAVTVC